MPKKYTDNRRPSLTRRVALGLAFAVREALARIECAEASGGPVISDEERRQLADAAEFVEAFSDYRQAAKSGR